MASKSEPKPYFDADDTAWGTQFVFCQSHGRVHGTGWCTVPPYMKIPLLGDTIEEATEEFEIRRQEERAAGRVYWLHSEKANTP